MSKPAKLMVISSSVQASGTWSWRVRGGNVLYGGGLVLVVLGGTACLDGFFGSARFLVSP